MSRPLKVRRICRRMTGRFFDPGTGAPPVELAADEVEALRLVDLEKLEQSQAARLMGISRGTLQRLLYAARRKTVFALLSGSPLALTGPVPEAASAPGCGGAAGICRFCPDRMGILHNLKGDIIMKIAVTCDADRQVFQHFGHTPEFAVFDVENGRIVNTQFAPVNGAGHGALAGFLADLGVNLLICGGIGGGAQMALAEAGIRLVGGVSGDVTAAVTAYLNGTLAANPDFSCHHHDHGEGHSCGGHGHGEGHSCGGRH